MDRLFTHTQFSSADMSSPTVCHFTALCHLHRLCASVRRTQIMYSTQLFLQRVWILVVLLSF